MKVVLLTTDTPHHRYFAWQVSRRHAWAGILFETRRLPVNYPTAHPFENQRDHYENTMLLKDAPLWDAIGPTRTFASANEPAALDWLRSVEADVALDFGTGRLTPEAIAASARLCLNLHGGDPEQYRGLDTHLWAIWHRDFDGLVTTLHHMDATLDTGDIVLQRTLRPTRDWQLHQVRGHNTEACIAMCLEALDAAAAGQKLPARPQRQRGRYYSAMPAVLKEECVARFAKHVKRL